MINNYKKNEQLKMDKFGVFKFILKNVRNSKPYLFLLGIFFFFVLIYILKAKLQ